jgi:hypothetical protein
VHNSPDRRDSTASEEPTVESGRRRTDSDAASIEQLRRELGEQKHRADERDLAADEREALADSRERVADDRERLADDRERLADDRERRADERDQQFYEQRGAAWMLAWSVVIPRPRSRTIAA